jgi:hypothetical protein
MSTRLVQQQVAEPRRRLDAPAVHQNLVASRIGLAAKGGDNRTIDRDAALPNQFFGGASRGHACRGEHLLQSVHPSSSSDVAAKW